MLALRWDNGELSLLKGLLGPNQLKEAPRCTLSEFVLSPGEGRHSWARGMRDCRLVRWTFIGESIAESEGAQVTLGVIGLWKWG